MHPVVERLKQRKIVQWGLAYLAGAGVVYSTLDAFGDPWGVTPALLRALQVLLATGFLVSVTLAWYHGEKGRQDLSRSELAILAGIVLFGALGLRLVSPERSLRDPQLATAETAGVGDETPVIGVLPFEDQGSATTPDFFTDGMHQDVMTRLSGISGFRVLARQAVAPFAGSDEAPGDIAAALEADWLVFGRVMRSGSDVRLNVELVDPSTTSNRWADSYRRDLSASEIFGIQEDVARRIADAVEVVLRPEESQRLTARPTQNMEAYDLYLQGREFYAARGPTNNDRAIEFFREALTIDSDYAEAWAGLGDAFGQRACCIAGFSIAWADSALVYADRAVSLNPDLAAAHKALGQAYSVQERLAESIAAYSEALRLDPSHAAAANNIGLELRHTGRHDEGVRWVLRALRVVPRHPTALGHLESAYQSLLMEERAADAASRLLDVTDEVSFEGRNLQSLLLWGERSEVARGAEAIYDDPDAGPADLRNAAVAMYLIGEFGSAAQLSSRALAAGPVPGERTAWHFAVTVLGLSRAMGGTPSEAEGVLEAVIADHELRLRDGSENWRSAWAVATANAGLGRTQEAREWLQRSYDLGFRELGLLDLEPSLTVLREDPRFEALRSRIAADLAAMRANVLEAS